MSKASRLSTEIAARQGVAQLELIHAADQLGNRADWAIREAWGKLLAEFERPSPGWQMRVWFLLQGLMQEVHRELRGGLERLAQGGHVAAATVLAQSLPVQALASPKVKVRAFEAQGQSGDRRRIGKAKPILIVAARTKQALSPKRPLVKLPKPRGVTLGRSEQRQRDQLQEMLFPALSPSKVEGYLRRPVFGKTWEQDLSQASQQDGFDPTSLINRMATAFSRGDTPQQIAKEIAPSVQAVSKVAKRVARTYGMQVSHAASREAHEQLGDMLLGYQIHAQLDSNTRPWHAARSGTIYYKEPTGDQKGYYQMPNPPLEADDPAERPGDAPKMAWRCLLPGSFVQGSIEAGAKISYAGQAVEAVTASGASVRVTANHPVFTPQGLVPANRLREGQHVLRYVGNVNRLPDYECDGPALVEDVFRSLVNVSRIVPFGPSVLDLHGDEQFVDGDVKVVRPQRKLLLDRKAQYREGWDDGEFVRGSCHAAGIASHRGLELSLRWFLGSPNGFVGRSGLPLPGFGVGDAGPFNSLRFGPASQLDASRYQDAHEARRAIPPSLVDVAARDAQFIRELLERFPGEVSLDQVIKVRHFEFSGHVYDLQGKGGWIISDSAPGSNGIFLSNCRCWLAPVLKALDAVADDPVFATAQDDLIADPVVFSDWFDQADERKKKLAVGAKSYSLLQEKLGGQAPRWEHFIEPRTGALLSTEALRNETPAQAWERTQEMRRLIDQRRYQTRQVLTYGGI